MVFNFDNTNTFDQTSLLASALPQKNAQLDDESHQLLHDVCCLWHYILPKMRALFPQPVVEKHEQMFMRGNLALQQTWSNSLDGSQHWLANALFPKNGLEDTYFAGFSFLKYLTQSNPIESQLRFCIFRGFETYNHLLSTNYYIWGRKAVNIIMSSRVFHTHGRKSH